MKPYLVHYYDCQLLQKHDEEILETLGKTAKVVDETTGRKQAVFDTKMFRQEGDFIISNGENRLHLCLSTDEVVQVPEGVKSIALGAFNEEFCPNAKHIILSSTVDGVSPHAIISHKVEELTVNNKYIFISEDAILSCSSLRMIHHIPGGATIYVKPDKRMEVHHAQCEAIASSDSNVCSDSFDKNDLPF